MTAPIMPKRSSLPPKISALSSVALPPNQASSTRTDAYANTTPPLPAKTVSCSAVIRDAASSSRHRCPTTANLMTAVIFTACRNSAPKKVQASAKHCSLWKSSSEAPACASASCCARTAGRKTITLTYRKRWQPTEHSSCATFPAPPIRWAKTVSATAFSVRRHAPQAFRSSTATMSASRTTARTSSPTTAVLPPTTATAVWLPLRPCMPIPF